MDDVDMIRFTVGGEEYEYLFRAGYPLRFPDGAKFLGTRPGDKMTKIEKLRNPGIPNGPTEKLNELIDAVNKLAAADEPAPPPRWAVVDLYRGYLFSDTFSKRTVSFADRADAEALRDLLTKGGMTDLRVEEVE